MISIVIQPFRRRINTNCDCEFFAFSAWRQPCNFFIIILLWKGCTGFHMKLEGLRVICKTYCVTCRKLDARSRRLLSFHRNPHVHSDSRKDKRAKRAHTKSINTSMYAHWKHTKARVPATHPAEHTPSPGCQKHLEEHTTRRRVTEVRQQLKVSVRTPASLLRGLPLSCHW